MSALAEQFDDLAQQKEASTLGMWTFLATEILFFGGMFMSYITYRNLYPHVFALASRHTILLLGTINTAVLLTSSLTMALAVHAAQENQTRRLVRFLLVTVFLGCCFLGVKGLGDVAMPPTGKMVGERLAYYIREGKHSMTPADWKVFMDFADKQWAHPE